MKNNGTITITTIMCLLSPKNNTNNVHSYLGTALEAKISAKTLSTSFLGYSSTLRTFEP